ncbi:MAG TPA: hypothetical protein VHF47_03755 [Acidimicrobiales bacterium]|nr:hypothetical protein [Acidimicrobiales bacterium]
MRRLLLPATAACAVVAGATLSSPPAAPPAAAAAPEHRAVVVVDTGREVRRICVRFAEDFITGQELLIRAGTDPVLRQYSGLGAAVCALCGVGCPPDESCLTCGGDTYWTYSRAPKGTSEFKVSGAGASNTKVYDGDVEGWRWSKGLLPAYASVDQVCGPAPGAGTTTSTAGPPTTTATAVAAGQAPAATTSTTARRATATTLEAGRAGGAAVGALGTTTTAPPETTTTPLIPDPAAVDGDDDTAAPTVPTGDDGSGGSAASLLAFAAVLAGLLAWALRLRRARRPGPS